MKNRKIKSVISRRNDQCSYDDFWYQRFRLLILVMIHQQ